MAEVNDVIKDFKVPTTLGKDSLYVNWKRETKIWKAFTSTPRRKTNPGEASEAILNKDIQ